MFEINTRVKQRSVFLCMLFGLSVSVFGSRPDWTMSNHLTLDTRAVPPVWVASEEITLDTRLPDGGFTFGSPVPIDARSWVTNLVRTASSDDSISLSWSVYPADLRGIEHYAVEYREFGDEGAWSALASPGLHAILSPLGGGTVYECRARPVIGMHEQEWTGLGQLAYTEPGLVYENGYCKVYRHAWTHQHGREVPPNIVDYFSDRVIQDEATDMFTDWVTHSLVDKLAVHVRQGMTFGLMAASLMSEVIGSLFDEDYAKVKVVGYYPQTCFTTGTRIFENEPVYPEVFLDLSGAIHDLDGEVRVFSRPTVLHVPLDAIPPIEDFLLIPDAETWRIKKGFVYRLVLKQPLAPWKMGWHLANSRFVVGASIYGRGNGYIEDSIAYDVSGSAYPEKMAFFTRGTLSGGGNFAVIAYRDGRYQALFESREMGRAASNSGRVSGDSTFEFSRGGYTYSGLFSYGSGGVIESVAVNVAGSSYSVYGVGQNQLSTPLPASINAMAAVASGAAGASPGLHVMTGGDGEVLILIGPDGNYVLSVTHNGETRSASGQLSGDGSIQLGDGDLVLNAAWNDDGHYEGAFAQGGGPEIDFQTERHFSELSVQAWYQTHFGERLAADGALLNSDHDGDGLSALLEYLCGLNPLVKDADQASGFELRTNDAGEKVMSRWFDVDLEAEGISYDFSAANTLTEWFVPDPAHRTMEEIGGKLRIRYDLPAGTNASQFIRFRVEAH